MYCCNTCKSSFDAPRVNHCGGGDSGESWSVCPCCGSDNIEEAEPCMLRTLQIEPDYPGARASLGRLQLLLSLQAEPASPGGSGTASAE